LKAALNSNEVEISVQNIDEPEWLPRAKDFALAALDRLDHHNWDLSVLICDADFIHELNREYRHRDEPTDVLSFAMKDTALPEPPPADAESAAGSACPAEAAPSLPSTYTGPDGETRFIAGDIVISLDGLARNVADFKVDRDEELKRLIVHGILHLSGMDHSDDDPAQPMLKLQEETLSALKSEHIL